MQPWRSAKLPLPDKLRNWHASWQGEQTTRPYREYLDKLQVEQLSADLNSFLAKLQQVEATKPGSVEVRPGTGKKTVIIVSKDHLNTLAEETPAGLA
jgi:hypothetical protein